LTKPITEDYLQYVNYIYQVDKEGKLTHYCTVNGNCR
jgi:hypothetical protein